MQRIKENISFLLAEKGIQFKDLSRELGIPRSTLYAGNLRIDSLVKICEFFEVEPTEIIYSKCEIDRGGIFMKDWVTSIDLDIFIVNINSDHNYVEELSFLIRKINHIDIEYYLVNKQIKVNFKYELQDYVSFTSSIIRRSTSTSEGTYYNVLLDKMEEEKKAIESILNLFNDVFEKLPEEWVKLFFYKYFLKYNRSQLLKTEISSKNSIYGIIAAVTQSIRDQVKMVDYKFICSHK